MLISRQHQRRSVGASHHGFKARFDLQQPMPTDLPVNCRKRVFIAIIGSLQGNNRIEEQPQSLGCFNAGVHVTLLFTVVGLRKQPTHQLDEHHHRIVGELLAEFDDLRHDRRASATGIEIG